MFFYCSPFMLMFLHPSILKGSINCMKNGYTQYTYKYHIILYRKYAMYGISRVYGNWFSIFLTSNMVYIFSFIVQVVRLYQLNDFIDCCAQIHRYTNHHHSYGGVVSFWFLVVIK